LGIYGSLKILDGLLRVEGLSGINLFRSGVFEIHGGKAELNMFRTHRDVGTHRGAYIQHGGVVDVRHFSPSGGSGDGIDWDGHVNYFRFALPYETATFIMTGGTLNVSSTRTTSAFGANGGILIASSEENYNVTGGTVNLIMDKDRNFIINSSAPFYNLNLIKEIALDREFYIADFPHPTATPSGDNPPPPVPAHPLRVINRLEVTPGSSLYQNGNPLII
jgi:hypothetical protein